MHRLPIIRDVNADLASERELHPGVKIAPERTLPDYAVQNVPEEEAPVRTRRTRPWRLVNSCERDDVPRSATRRASRLVLPLSTPDSPIGPVPPVDPPEPPCVAPDAPVIPEPEIGFTSCMDQVTFTFSDLGGNTVRLEVSDSEEGPWTPYLVFSSEETTMDNLFPEGTYFRFSVLVEYECTDGAHEEWVVFSGPTLSAGPPVVEIPTLVSLTNTVESPLGLINPVISPYDGATVSVVSDPNVGDGDAVEVRHRLQYTKDFSGPANPDAIATFSHPDGAAVIKWTRDNTRPTLATVNPGGANAAAGNPAAGKSIIRCRAFVGSCGSPELVIVIDVKVIHADDYFSITGLAGEWGVSCDFPKDPSGEESGESCNIIYGGTDAATEFTKTAACADATLAGTTPVIWKQDTTITVGNDGSGWLQHEVDVVEWRFDHCTFNRAALASFFNAYPSGFRTYLTVDFDSGTDTDFAGTTLTGVGGVSTDVEAKMNAFCLARTPACPSLGDGSDSMTNASVFITPFPPA